VKPLGHRTHLKAKARGESSMFGKAGHEGTYTNRAPVEARMAWWKAELPETSSARSVNGTGPDYGREISGCSTMAESFTLYAKRDGGQDPTSNTLQGARQPIAALKGTKEAPKPS